MGIVHRANNDTYLSLSFSIVPVESLTIPSMATRNPAANTILVEAEKLPTSGEGTGGAILGLAEAERYERYLLYTRKGDEQMQTKYQSDSMYIQKMRLRALCSV